MLFDDRELECQAASVFRQPEEAREVDMARAKKVRKKRGGLRVLIRRHQSHERLADPFCNGPPERAFERWVQRGNESFT